MPLYESKTATYSANTSRASLLRRVDTDLPFKRPKKKASSKKHHHHNNNNNNNTRKKKRKFSEDSTKGTEEEEGDSFLSLQALITGELKTSRSKSNNATPMSISLDKQEKSKRRERKKRFEEDSPRKEEDDDLHSRNHSIVMGEVNHQTNNSFVKTQKKKNKSEDDLFVGTCTSLEKPYLRLTTFPKPEAVRPLHILKKSFDHIKAHFIKNEDYEWSNEQLKSLRQDLSVQGIRNDFATTVYETHARLALEHGDMNEFNQCQSVIKSMTVGIGSVETPSSILSTQRNSIGKSYKQKNNNNNDNNNYNYLKQSRRAEDEFAAYRLLYALVQKDVGGIKKELGAASALIPLDQLLKTHRCQGVSSCRHAVLVTKALIHSDYHMFFALYENAPNLSGYLMDFLVHRVRISAYRRIVASFRPTLSVEFFRETLNFADLEDTRRFLKQNNATFVKEKGDIGPPFWVDCKLSL